MERPVLARTRAELADLLAPARREGRLVGFVPTMGALHAGHASLVRVARERVGEGPVVVSVFVNPMQFAPGEDLDRYPRTLDDDLKLCEREGVDIVFAPGADEVYPQGEPMVTVEPGPLAGVLEGRIRVFMREPKEDVVLAPGETFTLAPRRPHLVTNIGETSATFLVLQGIGEYDFVPLT